MEVTHVLFSDDSLVFCKVMQSRLKDLGWVLSWG